MLATALSFLDEEEDLDSFLVLDDLVLVGCFFDEEDLYEMREKPDLVRLRETIGEAPTNHSWTIWG